MERTALAKEPSQKPRESGESLSAQAGAVFKYSQSRGTMEMFLAGHVVLIGTGWAGRGKHKNRHESQSIKNEGPLPCGTYRVVEWMDHPRLGRDAAKLEQIAGETFGRDDFYIHGASLNPLKRGQESQGCIILSRSDRLSLKAVHPDEILVVP